MLSLVDGRPAGPADETADVSSPELYGELPAWLYDRATIETMIREKDDDLDPAIWHALARLARDVGELAHAAKPVVMVDRVRSLARAAADSAAYLPQPRPDLSRPSYADWADDLETDVDRAYAVAVRLTEALADPSWIDPHALAGWVADVREILTALRPKINRLARSPRRHRQSARSRSTPRPVGTRRNTPAVAPAGRVDTHPALGARPRRDPPTAPDKRRPAGAP